MPVAESGREGLIDSDGAVRTAEIGYIQYRLVKVLEDTVVPKVNEKAPTWTEAERERFYSMVRIFVAKLSRAPSPMTPVESLQKIHTLLVVCQKYYGRNGKQTQCTWESA
jgi:RNA polymerase Rpb1, domain 5